MTDEFQPGQVIGGRYRVLGKLGGGGMANVYLAEDATLGRRVAIKMLHRRFVEDPKFVERFRREAKAAAGLNHPNIVGVYDWGQADDRNYIVMEYVEGETLKELIRREGRLGGRRAVEIALELLTGVGAAHARGVVHRDIKSQNILIDGEGRAKVTDFGIAQAGDPGMTEVGSILGTAQYLAPEQARGEPVDERSDLYSVGVVLYEMLTGRVPFRGDSAVTVALKHVNEPVPEPAQFVPRLPPSLNRIILKALAKDPRHRYASADEFSADLRAALAGGPLRADSFDPASESTQLIAPLAIPGEQATQVIGARRAEGAARPTRPRRSRARLWLALGTFVALLAVLIAIVVVTAFGGGEKVPGVVGMEEAAAVQKLEQAGFVVKRHSEYSDRFAAGLVSRQEPKADTQLRKGGTVEIWVSGGATTVPLIDFQGQTPDQVEAWLKDHDLKGERKSGRSDAEPKGRVFKQSPSAGTPVKKGSTVTYWVSSGVPQVVVPSVIGMTAADAAARLNAEGLSVGTSSTRPSDTAPAGEVVDQNPKSGEKADKGSVVDLVISSGPATPTPSLTPTASPSPSLAEVPNVITMDQAMAEEALSDAGFTVKVRTVSDPQPPGTVVDTDPPPLSMVPPGSRVTIFVAA